METRASYVAVGAFVMICVVGLFAAMLWLAGSAFREEYSYYRTYFNGPVTGLGRGTVVRYNGVDVGRVNDLAFDPENPRRVFITLQIDPTLPLHVDSAASIESQGLTGATYIEIAGGTAEAPLLQQEPDQEFPIIPSKPSTLQQLAQAGPELVAKLGQVGDRFSDILNDDNREAFAELIANLRDTTKLITRRQSDLDATIVNLRTATQTINETLTKADRALSSVEQTSNSFQTTATSADLTAQKIGRLSDDADRVVTGQSMAQFTQLMAETRALVASVKRLTSDIEREPTRLIFGDQRRGYTPP